MKHITANTALNDFDDILDNVIEFGETVSIANDKGAAILISQEEWSGLQETLYLQSIPSMVDSIKAADAESLEDGIDASEVDFEV
jgi:PHD/YefM family antitoxin component YafN of YafNO toxin-antitoxin module